MPTLEFAVDFWNFVISVLSASSRASATAVSSASASISSSVLIRSEISSMATYSTLSFTRTLVAFDGTR